MVERGRHYIPDTISPERGAAYDRGYSAGRDHGLNGLEWDPFLQGYLAGFFDGCEDSGAACAVPLDPAAQVVMVEELDPTPIYRVTLATADGDRTFICPPERRWR